ncbi:MAG: hypothetical protein CVU47_03265 [Chloroflexi bacterium HGW-Chloroflexi-9]|nr:MAG: hypothetical protein CVU47_03265 [Chloroflexi bacterium HGW-Chloroflexi-9]
MRTVLGTLLVFGGLLVACDPDERPATTPVASASPSPTADMRPSPTPSTSPVDGTPFPFTARLIDLDTGEAHTLYEHAEYGPWSVQFEGDAVVVRTAEGYEAFGLDGQPLSPSRELLCGQSGAGVSIEGRIFPEVPACGPISPNRRFMTYRVDMPDGPSPAGHVVPIWDQWVVDIDTGERRLLQAGLFHCGGCDGRYAEQWSLGGRYLLFSEYLDGGRIFLGDAEAGTARVVGQGVDIVFRPVWSPAADMFLAHQAGGATALFDAPTGAARLVPLAWPAGFDASGSLAYSPTAAFTGGPAETRVLDLATGLVVVDLPGAAPPAATWTGDVVVAASVEGVTAALGTADCAGTVVYATGPDGVCLEGAGGGVPSPDGTRVALARPAPQGARVMAGGALLREYEVILYEVATGAVEVVADGAFSGPTPPALRWHIGGDRLLVVAPHFAGL